MPLPGGLALQQVEERGQVLGFLEGVPDEVAVLDLQGEFVIGARGRGAGIPGQLDDRLLQGMDQDLFLQGKLMTVPFLHGHHAPLDDLLFQPLEFLIGQELAVLLEVEDALAQEVVAELLCGHVAAQVDQVSPAPGEPSGALQLLHDQFSIQGLLADGGHQGGKGGHGCRLGHLGSEGQG